MSAFRQLIERLDRIEARMREWGRAALEQGVTRWRQVAEFSRRRRVRRIEISIVSAIALYAVLGFFVVPPVLRHVLATQVAASINRPVSAGKIRFNPFRLKLEIDQLHIGDRGGAAPFVDLGHFLVKVSWTSIFRLAPVVKEVEVDSPSIHLVRTGAMEFNFSDLIAPAAAKPEPQPPPKPSSPMRFAVSNIVLRDGNITLDDRFLGAHHSLEQIQIGVPFIANLPADTDIFVQPLLKMIVDGSPLLITGKAKPFASPPESVLDFGLHRLSIPNYLVYAPRKLPVKVPDGNLSCALQIHFVNADPHPKVSIAGAIAVDNLDIRDDANSPLLQLAHLAIAIADLEPLESLVHLKRIFIDGLNPRIVRAADGKLNILQLAAAGGGQSPPAASPEPQPAPSPSPASAQPPAMPAISLDSFEMTNSAVNFTDNSGPQPAQAALQAIHIGLANLTTAAQAPPASYNMAATLSGGGALSIKGTIDVSNLAVTTDFGLDQLDLPALQKFADPFIVAQIAGGKLTAHATAKAILAGSRFNVHVEPATLAVDNFDLRSGEKHEEAVGWKSISLSLADADLASHNATVKEVRTDAVHVFVERGPKGELNLASLLRSSPAPAAEAQPQPRQRSMAKRRREHSAPAAQARSTPVTTPAEPLWKFAIESIAIENTQAKIRDASGKRPVETLAAPINLHLKGVSSDLRKPFTLALDGALNGKGTFKIDGSVAVEPLKADLRMNIKRVDLSPIDPYLSKQLNATIASAALTVNGAATVQRKRDALSAGYRGDVAISGLRMLDKLTGDTFLRWKNFGVSRIDAMYGAGKPKVHIGEIALADFYARIILNRDGRMNLKDIVASPKQAPVSLTRAHPAPAPSAAPTVAAAPPPPPKPIDADIAIDAIKLSGGRVNYTDDFIKPNYTANLTDIAGSVGEFGTASTNPAAVSFQGKVNTSAPIDISGLINPLAPMASLDIKAKADGIELTGLSPYTVKYTGYPIVKGTLTVDVHYQLKDQNLTAENHIFIDQFTFGDHVESPDAINLPIRLAVALLKDSSGAIDLRVPISGSLNDPQFSIGSVILHVFGNLIVKAATSPFTLIASTFGSIAGGGSQELRYIEFAPGYDTLTADSKSRLDTIIKALKARPALKLDITGRVDPKVDTDGYREASVANQIRIQKMRAAGTEAGDYKSIQLTKDDYDKYLKAAYKAAKFDKPENFLGLDKSLPPEEMKKLMLANVKVDAQVLHLLADARANAVRGYLSKEISPSRLFVVAPKLNADGIKGGEKTTRVDLSLE
ncbi:MAG TPA: DUF748 domain-containing protein [Candidatus Binataceae bacterium]|nr:DUF748 domain-containing protein [Candidatus Binataceae bacterium]